MADADAEIVINAWKQSLAGLYLPIPPFSEPDESDWQAAELLGRKSKFSSFLSKNILQPFS